MYDRELNFAKELARKAGDMMREHSSPKLSVELKSDESPVTVADKAINDLALTEVAKEFPGHGVLGEEASNFNNEKFVWVCDPIDGTVSYIHSVPTSVFTITLVEDGTPIVTVTYNPWTDELYYATKGGGAFCDGNPIHVSDKPFEEASLAVSNSINAGNVKQLAALLDKLPPRTRIVSLGSSLYKGCLVAAGYFEGYIFRHSTPHDAASCKLIVEEAGGKCTDLQGNEQRYDQPINGAVISNGVIHDDLLKLV